LVGKWLNPIIELEIDIDDSHERSVLDLALPHLEMPLKKLNPFPSRCGEGKGLRYKQQKAFGCTLISN
jgi:hypothetical protein